MALDPDVDLELIDAAAPGSGTADVIFVFGTLHTTPAELAAEHFHAGSAPMVVVTGGESRARPGHQEAHRHADILRRLGVPDDAICVEDRSQSTVENVTLAWPKVTERVGEVRTVMCIVKWFHRRALVTLAGHVPAVSRIYAVDYEPFDPVTGKHLLRSTWATSSPRSVRVETRYMRELVAAGFDPLAADGDGWIRTKPAP